MSELEDKLDKLLSDPESLSQMLKLASSFLGGMDMAPNPPPAAEERRAETQAPPPPPPHAERAQPASSIPTNIDLGRVVELLRPLAGGRERDGVNDRQRNKINLLLAVKPFLEESDRSKIDRAVNLVSMSKTAQTAIDAFLGGGESRFV